MTQGIYEIRNKLNEKVYVGSSANTERRRREHYSKLRGGYHANIHLQRAWNKYGEDVFTFTVLEEVEDGMLLATEQIRLDRLFACGNHYNIATVAGPEGPLSEETRRKISVAQMGNQYSLGYKQTEEHIRKRIAPLVGHKRPPLTEEHKRKIGEAGKGRVVSDETRRKISKANKGKKHTEESKRKLSEASKGNQNCLGRKLSEETKRKIGIASRGNQYALGHKHTDEAKRKMRGRTVSKDTRCKISEARKQWWARKKATTWERCYSTRRPERYFLPDNHAGKMSWGLILRIVSHGERKGYWSPDDVIGDPMAGAGTNLSAFRIRGYEVEGIELEFDHFNLMLCNTLLQQQRYIFPQLRGNGGWRYHVGNASDVLSTLPEGSWDASVFSPPYEGALASLGGDGPMVGPATQEEREERYKWRAVPGHSTYGDTEGQIGAMFGEDYWKAMLPIYKGVYRVLKPGGILVVVTKDRREDWCLVRVGQGTRILCEYAGFVPIETIQAVGATRSVIARWNNRRYAERGRADLVVDHEDVMWFQKEDT